MADWRDDPRWILVEHDPVACKGKTPPAKPPASAELTGGGAWCAVFVAHRPIATWYRQLDKPTEKKKSQE